jgi:hypothetical protein
MLGACLLALSAPPVLGAGTLRLDAHRLAVATPPPAVRVHLRIGPGHSEERSAGSNPAESGTASQEAPRGGGHGQREPGAGPDAQNPGHGHAQHEAGRDEQPAAGSTQPPATAQPGAAAQEAPGNSGHEDNGHDAGPGPQRHERHGHGSEASRKTVATPHSSHGKGAAAQPTPATASDGSSGSGSASAARTGNASAGATASSGSAPASTASPAAAPASAPAASLLAAAPAPATNPSAPALAVRSTPQARSRTPHATRARHAQARRAARVAGSSARGRFASAAAASSAPLAVPAAAGGGAAGRTSQTPAPAAHRTNPSPIVTTITRIVDVVPAPMRILLGLLLALALALGARAGFAALHARRLERQRAELLADVGLLQAALLPVPPARHGAVGTSVAYRPADGPAAGGDFYDVFALEDGRLAVIVGDVSGHGRQALPHTALVRFTLRAYLEAGLSPRRAIQTAGAVLERQLGGSFATVLAATYDPEVRELTYASAGHPPPVVLGPTRPLVPVTASSAPPLGAGIRTGTRQTVLRVPGRARICFYTDGVTEARVAGQLYGSERLTQTLAELPAGAGAADLLERISAATDARPDDMAACLLEVAGSAAAPAALREELELDREQAVGQRTEGFLRACGVEQAAIGALGRAAHGAAGATGTVLLEVGLDGPQPHVELRRENLTQLPAPREQVPVVLGASS